MIKINKRRSIRLPHYDYRQEGSYFITICAFNRSCLFGSIEKGKMQLNEQGEIVNACWQEISEHFSFIELDIFVTMPNHFHGIINIIDAKKTKLPAVYRSEKKVLSKSLSTIIRSFKAAVTKKMHERKLCEAEIWQRNYYEHVIRNEESLFLLREYIINNPLQWELDSLHPDKINNNSIKRAQHAAPLQKSSIAIGK